MHVCIPHFLLGGANLPKLNLKVNIFATLVTYKRYNRIGYYSVKAHCNELCETESFFKRMTEKPECLDEVKRLIYWMRKVAQEYEAKDEYFRFEGLCSALPPPFKVTLETINIRLYCYIINENIVVLFNGDKKTKRKAQSCPIVKYHHSMALSWSRAISRLNIESDGTEIKNINELEFNY